MPGMRRPRGLPLGHSLGQSLGHSLGRPLTLLNGGHLGSSVSALVDGQLDAETSERAWEHVLHCPPCRRLVEHEGWVKRQLAEIADAPRADEPSDQLIGSLLHLDPTAVAWADTQEIEDRGRTRRRAGIALVGAGSVSAAVLGLSTLSGAPLGIGSGGTPTTSIGGATSTPTQAVVAPSGAVHGRLRGWTLGAEQDGVVHARAVANRR
jgi:anti-sigma factor RsiW